MRVCERLDPEKSTEKCTDMSLKNYRLKSYIDIRLLSSMKELWLSFSMNLIWLKLYVGILCTGIWLFKSDLIGLYSGMSASIQIKAIVLNIFGCAPFNCIFFKRKQKVKSQQTVIGNHRKEISDQNLNTRVLKLEFIPVWKEDSRERVEDLDLFRCSGERISKFIYWE